MLTFVIIITLLNCIRSSAVNFDTPALFQVTSSPLEHGECPTWDNRTGNLYFVDIHKGRLFSYGYESKNFSYVDLNGSLAPVIPTKNDTNSFIVGINDSLARVHWERENNEIDIDILASLKGTNENFRVRTNEGKADKDGRIFIGTMGIDGEFKSPNQGSLFRIESGDKLTPEIAISLVNISNGMAWNFANDKLFYIDSPTKQIVQFEYSNGSLGGKTIIFDLAKNKIDAHPDGMTIDEDDNLWVALYGGSSIIKINPNNSNLLETIAIPAKHVTSVVWGGPNLDILFVTTSRYSLSEEEKKRQPGAGHVYALTNLKTKGLPMYEAGI